MKIYVVRDYYNNHDPIYVGTDFEIAGREALKLSNTSYGYERITAQITVWENGKVIEEIRENDKTD